MEGRRRIINDDKGLLDHFIQKTMASIFEIPTQGRNTFSSNKIALEGELDKYVNNKITPKEKDLFFSEMNKIVARIQDFSVADLNDPLIFAANEENGYLGGKKEEVIASRYNIQITASDLKRIQNGNWFNAKIVDFYVNYLNEKLLHRMSHANMLVLPSLFFNLINAYGQVGDVSSNYQQVIELLIKKAEEIKKGEQNIFKLIDRMFFLVNLTTTHWFIIEVVKASETHRRPILDQGFEPIGMGRSWTAQKGKKPSKYLIILHDSINNYVKPEENGILKTMRTFLIYTMGKWGMKLEEEDFEIIYAETVKQEKMLESGAYICKFLDLLYQQKEQYDSLLLRSIKPLDIDHTKSELKDLIQAVGFRSVLPEFIFARF